MGKKTLTEKDVLAAVQEAYLKVYSLVPSSVAYGIVGKGQQFVNLIAGALCGKEIKVTEVTQEEQFRAQLELRCPKCNKSCKSSSGLTLHIKQCQK